MPKKDEWKNACGIGACLEVKAAETEIQIRNRSAPKAIITATPEEWEKFKQAIKEDRL